MSQSTEGHVRTGTESIDVFADLAAEGAALDSLVAELEPEDWKLPTSAEGWTIRDQIAHLSATDDIALLSARDAESFKAAVPEVMRMLQAGLEPMAGPGETPETLLARWRTGRRALHAALAEIPRGVRLEWFGPPMSAAGMATGRLMETWAHGGDVADALGVTRAPTAREWHIVRLGHNARNHAFTSHGLAPPADHFRLELTAPDGDVWTFGPEDAPQKVTGPAHDFALLATRRVHRDDTALVADGPDADRWLDIAQAFVGAPGEGRAAGTRRG